MNDVIINKVQSIQRCVKRAKEEYEYDTETFPEDFTRQDAAILNLTRACEQAIDAANHLVKKMKLGIPVDGGNSFELLAENKIIPRELALALKKMIGFRNTAVHEYQSISIPIVINIITEKTADLIRYTELLLPLARGVNEPDKLQDTNE